MSAMAKWAEDHCIGCKIAGANRGIASRVALAIARNFSSRVCPMLKAYVRENGKLPCE